MSETYESVAGKVLRGIVAGVVAGAIASFAMDRFQAGVAALSSQDEKDEPATERAADAVEKRITGEEVVAADKPLAGEAIHYALGIGLGVAYSVVAEFRPAITAGYGTAFGVGTATVLDEGAVPAVGLGDAPWNADPMTTLHSYASHLVFGGVAELVRRQVRSTLVD